MFTLPEWKVPNYPEAKKFIQVMSRLTFEVVDENAILRLLYFTWIIQFLKHVTLKWIQLKDFCFRLLTSEAHTHTHAQCSNRKPTNESMTNIFPFSATDFIPLSIYYEYISLSHYAKPIFRPQHVQKWHDKTENVIFSIRKIYIIILYYH